MDDDNTTQRQKARNCVYRLIKYRIRSEKEVRDKLRQIRCSKAIIDETVEYFKELELIDDRAFAQKWISSRLQKPFGEKRIRYELEQKGIDRTILKEELDKACEEYCEEDIVLDLARERLSRYKNVEPEKAKQRLFGYLNRRGFSPQVIYKAISNLQ